MMPRKIPPLPKRSPQNDKYLAEQIHMLQVCTRQVFELAQGEQQLSESVRALRALGAACTQLAMLLKARAELEGGQENEMLQALQQVIQEVLEEHQLA